MQKVLAENPDIRVKLPKITYYLDEGEDLLPFAIEPRLFDEKTVYDLKKSGVWDKIRASDRELYEQSFKKIGEKASYADIHDKNFMIDVGYDKSTDTYFFKDDPVFSDF